MKLLLEPLSANGWIFDTCAEFACDTAKTLIGVGVGAPPFVIPTK